MIKCENSKCIKCGMCIKACPMGVLKFKKGYPVVNPDKKNSCIVCYHCTAVCKNQAIYDEDNRYISERAKGHRPTLNSEGLSQQIKEKRSIRHFREKHVKRELIEDILNTVMWAPSAKNQHPTKWVVISDKTKIEKIMNMVLEEAKDTGRDQLILSEYSEGNNMVTLDAPHLLLAYSDSSAINGTADSIIAVNTADLLLHENGIGTCWTGYLVRFANNSTKIREFLGIAENSQIYGGLSFGYADHETYDYIPFRKIAEINWL